MIMRRIPAATLAMVLATACPGGDDETTGGAAPTGTDDGGVASSSAGDTLGVADTSGGDTSGVADTSGGGTGGAEVCPLDADHIVELTLDETAFTPSTVDLGADSFEWSLVAEPPGQLPAFSPGETVAISLRLEGAPLTMVRAARNLYVTITASADGTTRAQAVPETTTAAEGELEPGPWQPSLSINAGGAPIRLQLGGIHVNPDEGQTLSCISMRATIPAQANSVEDSSLVDITASSDMPIVEVRLSATGDGPEAPFALALGG